MTFTIEVNNKILEAQKGDTILDALKRNGLSVPTLCYMKDLFPTGACRMCVVEVEGYPNLLTACSYPVAEGMKIQTHSPRVLEARKVIVELLLADHPDDCLYCSRNKFCELQNLAEVLHVRERRISGKKSEYHIDQSSPSVVRDPAKCILCGRCIRVCEEIQGVSAIEFVGRGSKTVVETAFRKGLNLSSCVNCGQCILVCPTGALIGKSYLDPIQEALHDPEKVVVVQHAPAVSVAIAEEFGVKPGKDFDGLMVAALRKMGFDYVFDTSFSADLTIMEESSEVVERLTKKQRLPVITTCCPAWIKYSEEFVPEFFDNLSSCKSPQQMLGAVIKSYFAEKQKIDPEKIFSVSIMPCAAKKFEQQREQMIDKGISDVDAVMTTRELARMIRKLGIDIHSLQPEKPDSPLGMRSSAGKIFGVSGGVMEAALRTAYHTITGDELKVLDIPEIRGLESRKEAKINVAGIEVGVAVVSGFLNARKLLEEIKAGRDDIHFIEIMACPGGCINGGGQPFNLDQDAVKARMKALYEIDGKSALRTSHNNPEIKELYDTYLGKPLSKKSHKLLHTKYKRRDKEVLL